MEQVLDALGGILLRSIPTVLLVILVHFYLKFMFFRPMSRVLNERYEASEGARKTAEASLAKAEQKAAEYEEAIRNARSELYKEQDEMRRAWRDEQARAVADARQSAEQMVAQARENLARDLEQAKRGIEAESEALANQIVASVLQGKVA
jgi:F-type H+-transporting ATPase subunit b